MDEILKVLVMAAGVEAVWQTLKMVWQEGHLQVDRIGALAIGVFACVAAGLDIFALVGVPFSVAYAGQILTGVLVSRGANFVHDFLGGVERLRTGTGSDFSGEA